MPKETEIQSFKTNRQTYQSLIIRGNLNKTRHLSNMHKFKQKFTIKKFRLIHLSKGIISNNLYEEITYLKKDFI